MSVACNKFMSPSALSLSCGPDTPMAMASALPFSLRPSTTPSLRRHRLSSAVPPTPPPCCHRLHPFSAMCCFGTTPATPIGTPTPSVPPPSTISPNPFPDRSDSKGKASVVAPISRTTESTIERVIFDFRFMALLAIGGSLAGSVLCFLNGCIYIVEAYKVYWTACLKGIHTGQMVLRLVEAIDVYLAGTVMLIFGMGLYELFICNVMPEASSRGDRALQGSSLFGMFALKERPAWMKISSLDELKTKVGHVIVMILLVKMFERSKMVQITTGMDLLSYSVCIFLSSASLYILHNLHKSEKE